MEQRARIDRSAPQPVLSGGAAAARAADPATSDPAGTTRPASPGTTMNRTKIVATIGPASRTPEVLRQLIEAGVDVFRLNFSHGTHEEHSAVLADIRRISAEMDHQVAVLQDLCGPKIRLEPIPGDVVECRLDDEFTLVAGVPANARELACSYRELPNDLAAGESVLFADGTVAMTVVDTAPGRARLRVTLPGRVRSRQGLNLPGTDLAVSSLTEKDLRDLDWTAQHAGDVDFVALSFVRSADDVTRLRRELEARACTADIVVKIEKPQAVAAARGDRRRHRRGDGGARRPGRRDGRAAGAGDPEAHHRGVQPDAPAGDHGHADAQQHGAVEPADAGRGERRVQRRPRRHRRRDALRRERHRTVPRRNGDDDAGDLHGGRGVPEIGRPRVAGGEAPLSGLIDAMTEASVDAACLMTRQLDAALIVVDAASGRPARALANRRPAATILALPDSDQIARRLSLCWGVIPVVLAERTTAERALRFGIESAKSRGLVAPGQHAVLLADQVEDRPNLRAVLAGTIN